MKTLLTIMLFLSLLMGCQKTEQVVLDTSKLTEVEGQDNSAEQGQIPITYHAPSVKVALKSLPFELTLPKELPFDAEPFEPVFITDEEQDGKIVTAKFISQSKDKKDGISLEVMAFNHEFLEISQDAETIKLNNEITGYYYERMLNFHSKGVSYIIMYKNNAIPADQHKNEAVALANQILEQ